MEKTGAKLAVFESRRENDCVAKFLIQEYEDVPGQQYAIGTLRQLIFSPELSSVCSGMREPYPEGTYKGVYEWHRVDSTTDNKDAATLTFTNWVPSKTSLWCLIKISKSSYRLSHWSGLCRDDCWKR